MAAAAAIAADESPIPGLPYDVAVKCIALVPVSYHSSISRVSRSWRSLLRSPLLFTVRSSVGAAEPLILLAVGRLCSSEIRYALVQPSHGIVRYFPPAPLADSGAACASIGTSLYVLGGYVDGKSTNTVQILDLLTALWRLGPGMQMGRHLASAAVVSNRLLVVGGCPHDDSWAEALDVAQQGEGAWEVVPSSMYIRGHGVRGPPAVIGHRLMAKGKADWGGVVYDAVERRWEKMPPQLIAGWCEPSGGGVVVNGVIYTYDISEGKIRSYLPESDEWLEVKGLEEDFPPNFLYYVTLVDLGGVLCMTWEWKQCSGRKKPGKKLVIEVAGIHVTGTTTSHHDRVLKGSILWTQSFPVDVPKQSWVKSFCISLCL